MAVRAPTVPPFRATADDKAYHAVLLERAEACRDALAAMSPEMARDCLSFDASTALRALLDVVPGRMITQAVDRRIR